MMAGRKKKAQKKRDVAGPTAMEMPDPRQSQLEVPEESLQGQPSPVGPGMESSSALDVILQLLREVSRDIKQLRAGQDSLLSEMAELRTSAGQMNQWLDLAESRFSSLEDTARETHQTNSIMSTSQPDPMGVPTASSSSFSPHLDAAQPAASSSSASVYPGDALSEPPPPSSSEQFRTASSAVVDSETEMKALQMLAAAWTQARISASETARSEAEESGQQEDTSSGESLLIAPEHKTKPQLLTGMEEKPVQTFDALLSQEKIPESQPAHTGAEESVKQEDTSCGSSPREYKPEPQLLMSILPETPQPPSPAEMQKEAPLTATQLSRRRLTNKRSGSSASAPAAASAGALGHLVSSPPTEVVSPTKRPRASIAWRYFTKHPTSKFIATCNICGVDVKTGKIGGCGKVGTSALLKHIKCIHHIAQEKKAPSVSPAALPPLRDPAELDQRLQLAPLPLRRLSVVLPRHPPTEVMSSAKHPRASIAWRYFTKYPMSKFIATCDICGENVKTGKIGGKVGTAPLLSHIKCIHHIVLKK